MAEEGAQQRREEEPDLVVYAEIGDIAMVRQCIRKGNNVNVQNQFGDTALHVAIKNLQLVQLLLREKADPNIQNDVGNTVLHVAALEGELSAVKELLYNSKADPRQRNNRGRLAVDLTRSDRVREELLGEGLETLEVQVPKEKHGAVIGKGGAKLQEFQEGYGVQVRVPKPNQNSEIITLKGLPNSVQKVKRLILELTSPKPASNVNLLDKKEEIEDNYPAYVKVTIPKDKHKFIIGKRGQKLQSIMEEFDVYIKVPQSEDLYSPILICGNSTDDIDKALRYIYTVAEYKPKGKPRRNGTNKNENSPSNGGSTEVFRAANNPSRKR